MLFKRHPFFPKFRELIAELAAHSPTFDLGTNRRFAKEISLVRDLFDESRYFAGGYRPDFSMAEPCDFHCDIQSMPEIADASVGSVICMEVLEHVEMPLAAVCEMHRILRKGGVCIAAVPFLISYHGKRPPPLNPLYLEGKNGISDSRHEAYGDYWRFTHEGLVLLFQKAGFGRIDIWPIDGYLISRLNSLGLYHRLATLPLLGALLNMLDRPRLGRATTLHVVRAYK